MKTSTLSSANINKLQLPQQNSHLQISQFSTRSTQSGSSQGLYSRQGILQRKVKSRSTVPDKNFTLQDQDFQKTQTRIDAKTQKLMQIHEYRRIAFFGSSQEKRAVQKQYKEDCDFLLQVKQQKEKEFERRDKLHTQQCQIEFDKHNFDELRREVAKREQAKRVLQDNLMMAENKKRQEIQQKVKDNIKDQQAILDNKVKYSAMIR